MVALVIESWVWYGIVMLVASSRFISRRMTLGSFRRLQSDDWLMLLILCFYTTLVATINIVRYANSNLLPPGFDVNTLGPEDIREREYGSKLILVVEQCQCSTIWGVKACLLVLYARLTTGLWENRGIKVLACYVGFGFVFMEVFYFAVWCRPFYEYWQVPTNSVQCDAATNHLITNATLNLSSDCIMIAIALPMFLRLKLPWRKKVPIIGIFSLGVFVILAAVLNKVYSFTEPFGSAWTYWYVRESSTALLVANLPFVWTFWRMISGTKTTQAATANRSMSLEQALSRQETRNTRRNYPSATMFGRRSESSLDRIELNGGGRGFEPNGSAGAISFEEMLGEPYRASSADANPTPYSHPRLFFGRKGQVEEIEGMPRAPAEKAIIRNDCFLDEEDLVRRDSGSDTRARDTPISFPQSINSQKSTGSFV